MRMYDLIDRKKRGGTLSKDEICEMIRLYTAGEIPDYQMSAFLMATWCNGMSDEETFALTSAMTHSGEVVDLSQFGDKSVDKHSTGGVGDKTTLIVAPIVASVGGVVAKMSGRGLGHTGGTVDKLESFPGFKTSLSAEEFASQASRIGLTVIGQSKDLAPADKKLYALRDVTATVDCVPLIASSIMSKKLAAGTHSIVLDVKCGSGAFMRTPEDAARLAETMVKIGRAHGRNTAALITDMDVPLGRAVGNALEVREAIEVLSGGGPSDLRTVCLALASLMIELSLGMDKKSAEDAAEEALKSGAAYAKFVEWIGAQGGDNEYAKNPDLFGEAKYERDFLAAEDGYIASVNAELIGTAAMILGAGRRTVNDVIDPRAGIVILKKTGESVKAGEPILKLYSERENSFDEAIPYLEGSYSYSKEKTVRNPLIYRTVGGSEK